MVSDKHETIISDIGNLLAMTFHPVKREIYLIREANTANPLMGFPASGFPHADLYIFPDDRVGPIIVEVGQMIDGKWDFVIEKDDKPVRVLRISFDRFGGILNPRNTEFEKELLAVLQMLPAMGKMSYEEKLNFLTGYKKESDS